MDWQELAMRFQSRDDWSGLSHRDFRTALEELALNVALPGAGPAERQQLLALYKDQIEYVLYSMDILTATSDSSDLSVAEIVKRDENKTFDANAKRNTLVAYMNSYLYKYINNVELHNLRALIEINPELSVEQAVDFYIATLVYPLVAVDNPSVYFTFRDVPEPQVGRNQALEALSAEMANAYKSNDELQMFKSTFYAMTNFGGGKYRPVHKAMVTLLDLPGLGEFRETFYENLPKIIENKGAIRLSGITA